MAIAAFSVRMDEQLKNNFERMCESFGISMTAAINLFATAVVNERRIPFEIRGKTWTREEGRILFETARAQALAKNPDGNVRKSTYITKEKGKPLEMYHVWDFDITLGNCNYTNFEKPDGWQMRYVKWYNQMFHDPLFKQAVVERWNDLYPSLLEVPEFIDRQYRLMNGAEAANFEKWQILGQYVWPNKYVFDTYQEEYGFLKDFYLDRLAWLNERINSSDY